MATQLSASGHAKLSPSAAHRWMNCPGSVRLIGDESSTTGQAAMLGTAAHKIIEIMIRDDVHEAQNYFGYWVHVKAAGDEESEVFAPDDEGALQKRDGWFAFIVDETMVNGVQVTIDEVDRLREVMFKPEVFGERFLDMSWLDDRLGGTADVTLVEPFGWAHLVDHKNGYVIVNVKDNEQMKNYAVGVAHEHPDCEGVRVTISQPNAPHAEGVIRTEEYTIDELKIFEIQMKEAAEATSKPNAPLRAGDWCNYCPAKTRCKAFDELMAQEAAEDFGFSRDEGPLPETLEDINPDSITVKVDKTNTAELARKARWIPLFDTWARDIEGAIQTELMNGSPVEGFKLVRGKSNRKYVIETNEIEQRVNAEVPGFPLTDLWEPSEFKSPAQLEKLGRDKNERKLFKSIVSVVAAKGPGKLTVAGEDDPREAVDPATEAANEFAADPAEGNPDE